MQTTLLGHASNHIFTLEYSIRSWFPRGTDVLILLLTYCIGLSFYLSLRDHDARSRESHEIEMIPMLIPRFACRVWSRVELMDELLSDLSWIIVKDWSWRWVAENSISCLSYSRSHLILFVFCNKLQAEISFQAPITSIPSILIISDHQPSQRIFSFDLGRFPLHVRFPLLPAKQSRSTHFTDPLLSNKSRRKALSPKSKRGGVLNECSVDHVITLFFEFPLWHMSWHFEIYNGHRFEFSSYNIVCHRGGEP